MHHSGILPFYCCLGLPPLLLLLLLCMLRLSICSCICICVLLRGYSEGCFVVNGSDAFNNIWFLLSLAIVAAVKGGALSPAISISIMYGRSSLSFNPLLPISVSFFFLPLSASVSVLLGIELVLIFMHLHLNLQHFAQCDIKLCRFFGPRQNLTTGSCW